MLGQGSGWQRFVMRHGDFVVTSWWLHDALKFALCHELATTFEDTLFSQLIYFYLTSTFILPKLFFPFIPKPYAFSKCRREYLYSRLVCENKAVRGGINPVRVGSSPCTFWTLFLLVLPEQLALPISFLDIQTPNS